MEQIKNTLTFARCYLSNRIKKFVFNSFNGDTDIIIDVIKNKLDLPNENDIKNEIKDTLLNQCRFISLNDKNYPIFLQEINDAPIVITIKGQTNICSKNNIITSSGTRMIDFEDIEIISNILNALKNDFIIASGLALGSDSISHMQTYKTGSIAVLANGLGHCYPKENQYLIEKIVANGGCIISEYQYDKRPTQTYFLQRDKLLAGLSASTLIMRAKQVKSGSIATANCVRKIGRKLYTILPENGENLGNQWLLDNNYATLITNLEELTYNLLIDIAELINKIKDKQSHSYENNKQLFSQQIYDYQDKNSILNEIDKILKHTQFQDITFNNLINIYDKICTIQPHFTDNKIVKQALIEKIKKTNFN